MPEPRGSKMRTRGARGAGKSSTIAATPTPLPQDRTRRHARQAPRVGIIVSRYNASITDHLLEGALGEFERAGGSRSDAVIVDAPGAYELIALSLALAKSRRVDGIVALGCIIKGETIHDRVIADAIANGLSNVVIVTGVPVALGVLTVNTIAQATARAGGEKGNKGAEAISALLATIAAIHRIAHPTSTARSDHQSKHLGNRPDKGRKHGGDDAGHSDGSAGSGGSGTGDGGNAS